MSKPSPLERAHIPINMQDEYDQLMQSHEQLMQFIEEHIEEAKRKNKNKLLLKIKNFFNYLKN